MKAVEEKRLKKISEPEYGTILYRDKTDPELFYLSVLCGGIGQYERSLIITKAQFDELHLDKEYNLKCFAYEIAKGKKGFEEVRILPTGDVRLQDSSKPKSDSRLNMFLTFGMPPFVRFESFLLSTVGLIFFSAVWWVIPQAEAGVAVLAITGILALGFGIWAIDDIVSFLTGAPTLTLSRAGLTIKRKFFFSGDTIIPWVKIDSAPQVRRFFRIGRGPVRQMLLIHLNDGSWKSINEVRVDTDIHKLQLYVLQFLNEYGKFDPARAIPITVNPFPGKYFDNGGISHSTMLRDYALRFLGDSLTVPKMRAIEMCFPKATELEIEEAIGAARKLVNGAGAVYKRFREQELNQGEAIGLLKRQFPGFSDSAYASVMGKLIFEDR